MELPGAYVVNSPNVGEYCNNCMHYSNNYCIKFKNEVAPYGWWAVWKAMNYEIRST